MQSDLWHRTKRARSRRWRLICGMRREWWILPYILVWKQLHFNFHDRGQKKEGRKKNKNILYKHRWSCGNSLVDFFESLDTGEPVFLPFRMSCFVLSNLVVTAGMLTPGLKVCLKEHILYIIDAPSSMFSKRKETQRKADLFKLIATRRNNTK